MLSAGLFNPRMKYLFTGIIILLSIQVNAQISFIGDTVRIKEVIISGNKKVENLQGYKKSVIDSSIIGNFINSTLADLLVKNSTIYIKSYGLGGSASPSFRGTGANHTQLQWNNININNPMLGQPDLSLIPAAFAEDIEILYGGSSIAEGIGGIGGTINLESKPVWNNGSIITLSPSAGSFGRYTGLVTVKAGNQNFQSVSKGFIGYAKNNFSYLNDVRSIEPIKEQMQNSEVLQKGLMQELFFKKADNILSARLWYQLADRNLPSTMLMPQSSNNEKQIDESLRTMISYDGKKGLSDYYVLGSFLLSRLNYSNQLASINSENLSESVIIKSGLTKRIGDYIRLKMVLENDYTLVKTENYGDNKAGRNVASVTAMADLINNRRIGASFLIKEILVGNSMTSPDFSTGLKYKISEDHDYLLKANFSRNSKLPTMNDLFWIPGGNSDLLNENAYTYELVYEMVRQFSNPVMLKFDLTLYHNSIRNMIQWKPGIYSFWTAENVKSVNTSGLESSAVLEYKNNRLTSIADFSYTFTNATTVQSEILNDESIGKQLIYVPKHLFHASLRINFSDFYTEWRTDYTGSRFTTADNSIMLPAYTLNSFTAGYKLHHKSNNLMLSFTVDNLFNISYQTIAFYPQPGRSYAFKLLIHFIKKS